MNTKLLSALLGLLAFSGAANAKTVQVQIVSMGFSPKQIQIEQGDTVEFVNTARIPHTVTADPSLAANAANVVLPVGAAAFDSGSLQSGETFSHTFDVAGDYQYICRPHERMGMMGRIAVMTVLKP
ncbi:cupredoxin domain-containing protein [bacterium]|nr:cupredoxin domain-containing protein [bacterium]